jgi:hypothetical protein
MEQKEKTEKTTIPQVWNKHPIFGRCDSSQVEQKSWQVLSVAIAFSCIESFRDLSPLKRVFFTRDWVGAAKRNGIVPLYLVRGRLD